MLKVYTVEEARGNDFATGAGVGARCTAGVAGWDSAGVWRGVVARGGGAAVADGRSHQR